MSHPGSRAARSRSITLAAVLLVALGVLALLTQPAFAGTPLNGGPAPLTGSSFQGADGNQKTPLPGEPDYVPLPARTDWQNYAASPRVQTLSDASELQDTWFKQGKEQEPDSWTFQQSEVHPGKADVLGAWTVADPVSSNVFLYLSFFRAAAGGTTFYNFELNQQSTTWTNSMGTVIPCRRNGDVIVTFELQGGAGDVGVAAWRWTSDPARPGPAACPEGRVGTWTATGALSTDALGNTIAQGAMNSGEIDNYLDFNRDGDDNPATDPSPTKFSAPDTFGEAALNLSKVLAALNQGDSCFNFGQLQLHTRSSAPFTADLKDFIAPKPILARSCSIDGTKYHDLNANGQQDAGENGLAGFRIYADTNHNNAFDAGEPNTFTADGSQPGAPLGSWTLTKLPAGNYEIREDLSNPAGNPRASEGWRCSDPGIGDGAPASVTDACEFAVSLAAGGAVSGLKFGNYKQAVVKVEKQTVPDGAAGSFSFTSTIPGKAAFELSDGGVDTTSVNPGTYTATEVAHPAFDLTGIACTGDADSSGAGSTATFRARSGETITCVFTNTRKTGKLTVRKVLDPATDAGKFDLKIVDDVVVDDGGHLAQGSRTLPTGTGYTVSEQAGTGTSLAKYSSSVMCRDGQTVVASGSGASLSGVPVIEGREVVCTITNTRRNGSITVVKDLLPATDGGRFDLLVGDDVVKAAAGDGDSGTKSVAPGTYRVSEASANGTSPAKYDSAIACRKNGVAYESGAGTSIGGLAVDSDDTVVCTITNTRLATVTVAKTEGGEAPERTWTFRLSGGPDDVSITRQTASDGSLSFGDFKPGAYTLCEIDIPAGWHSSLGPKVGAEVCVELELLPGEAETVAVDNTRPATLMVKEGNLLVHHGDAITYTFDVSNAGSTPLKDVSVEDDRCDAPPVRDAANDTDSDGDALLERDEVWRFACTKVVGAHAGGEENPIVNVATAHAFDQAGNEVTDTDDHRTTIIHPGIAVDKELRRTGGAYRDGDAGDDPLPVHRGDMIEYRFTVTNTGDTPLTVAFSDPRCDSQPTEPDSGDADDDGRLDVAETWIYRCSHLVTDGDADPFDNTVTVTGADVLGGPRGTVKASDTERADIVHPDIEVDKQVRRLGTGEFVNEGLQAHVGDTLEYRLLVTDGASDTPVAGVELSDPRCDAGTLRGPAKAGGDGDDLLEDSETWTYTCTHVITGQDPNPLPNTATATGRDTVGCPDAGEPVGDCGEVEDTDTTSVRIITPRTLVVKEGNLIAYPGDTVTFTFAVTNAGDTPLRDVGVTDDRCAPVTGPTEKRNGNADDLLDPGETWIFTCAKQIPANHRIGDENPIRNVATATGTDPLGKTVTSTDDHLVKVLHPAVDIAKTGPPTAPVGTPLGYTLTVRNPGDVAFAVQDVAVTDPRCEAPPAGPGTGADATPGTLDPGDTWTYTCVAQTTGQPAGTFLNTARVDAKDPNGRTVTDTAEFPTNLTESQGVLREEIVSGTARLRGPSGCVKKAFAATVRGRRIAGVTFYVDGDRLKRIAAKRGQRRFTVKLRPGARVGVHRLTARIEFRAASQTSSRTLRLTYRRCARQVLQPRFTG